MSNTARANRAKGRNSFLLYDDFYDVLQELTDEEAGAVFREIYKYRLYLKDPEHYQEPEPLEERFLRTVLSPIKGNLKRDWESYLDACESKKNNKTDKDEDSG